MRPSAGIAGLEHVPKADRYRASDVVVLRADRQSAFLYSASRRHGRVLPATAAAWLGSCRAFKTLGEHAREWAAGAPGRRAPDEHALETLVREGFLLSEAEVLRALRPDSGLVRPGHAIRTLVVPTRDRPRTLERCLASFIENTQRHGRSLELVIADDSAASASGTRELLLGLRSRSGAAIRYAGAGEKRAFLRALKDRADVPADVLSFGLLGRVAGEAGFSFAGGANRNTLLLDTVGEWVLSADDDTVCRPARAGRRTAAGAIDSRAEPRELRFFRDREAAFHAVGFEDQDVLADHEAVLGHSIGGFRTSLESVDGWTTEAASGPFLARLAVRPAQVVLSVNGLVGHSGMQWPVSLLWRDGPTLRDLTRSEDGYRAAVSGQEALCGVDRLTISDGPSCMTTFVGCDNRTALAPFFPVLRNHDGLWGATLRAWDANCCFAYLPTLLVHSPLESRVQPDAEPWRQSGQRTTHMLSGLIAAAQAGLHSDDPSERLRRLGRQLTEIASLPAEEWLEILRLDHAQRMAARIARLEERLHAQQGEPRFWADDVRRHAAAVLERLGRPDGAVPVDLLEGRDPRQAAATAARLTHAFGRLLCWWPRIVEAALALRREGVRVSRAV